MTAPTIDTRAIERTIWGRIALANLVGVIPINIYFTIAAEYFRRRIDLSVWYVLLPVAVYIPAYAWSRIQARKGFAPIARWVDEGRTPTADERQHTITHPRRLAIVSFWCWMWALACSIVGGIVQFEPLGVQYIRIVVTILFSTMIACALCYLVAESAMRPLFSLALAEEGPKPSTVGVMPRLTLTWIVGSASYFVAIALLVTALPSDQVVPFVIGACAFALIVGYALTVFGSRSVARPLTDVRDALAAVESGDLSVEVQVDDAGEIGQLQSGFNRMVKGLRERDRLKLLFDRHVGPDVAQRAVASESLGGEQLDATVLFVDVIGSTTLAAERPPESVVAMLNALFGAVVRIVGDEGGLVNQFQGDGALCLFGAPHRLSDHAARGLRAAAALRREIESLGDSFPGFDAAIGVSSGRVVGGDVGTEDRYEYTVIGDAANEASRLTDEAKQRPGRVLISEDTIRAAGVDDGWIACGEFALRGRPTPTIVYEPASPA